MIPMHHFDKENLMFISPQRQTHSRLKLVKSLTAIALIAGITSGCNSDNKKEVTDNDASMESQVHFMLASVDNGTCSIIANGETIASADTEVGVARFQDIPADTGFALVECEGGEYLDEASGEIFTPSLTRAYYNVTSSTFSTSVTPLTEIATQVVEVYDLDPITQYSNILTNVGDAFGMKDFDLTTAIPMDLNIEEADGSAGGRYGVVLAALSQMQLDIEADSADEVIETLVYGMANNGLFTSDEIRDYYFYAMENMFDNPRIDPNLGYDVDLDAYFHDVVLAPLASQVEYVDADHPESTNYESFSTITASETSTFDIVGTHLSLNLDVTLNGDKCSVYDLEALRDTNNESEYNVMYADCPAQNEGEVNLVVMDGDRLENTTAITVEATSVAQTNSSKNVSRVSAVSAVSSGSSYLFGTITAEAPGVVYDESAAHKYDSNSLEIFPVAGVPVEMIDANGGVIASTISDADGYYEFNNAPESTAVKVVVKAQLQKSRSTPNVGAQYDFSVRDNTSDGDVKKLYELTSSAVTIKDEAESDNPFDIRAKIGFDSNGHVISGVERESAPFSILRIVKSAADKLEAMNSNIEMPALNLYWSTKNIATSGEISLGQIGTSYYSGSGLWQGVFILGKADSDTDEFDKGVIGHEFGHYLQAQLSYSDSPGDSHSYNEYKDASLAYGEGYGTAVGGLLSGSHYYCDTSGEQQLDGACENLKAAIDADNANGFYSEETVIKLMYSIGTLNGKGFTEFFDAVSKMKTGIHSATIFAFLDHYLKENPDVETEVKALMVTANVKTSDPFGVYPANTQADPKINAAANKGNSSEGAADLEKLYLTVNLSDVDAPNGEDFPAVLSNDSPEFCLNNNLPGANLGNGLGMRRRAEFTANYTGNMVVSAFNKLNHVISDQSAYIEVRDDTGSAVRVNGFKDGYFGRINVVSGRRYSLVLNVSNPEIILKGSQCGYYFELARSADSV